MEDRGTEEGRGWLGRVARGNAEVKFEDACGEGRVRGAGQEEVEDGEVV